MAALVRSMWISCLNKECKPITVLIIGKVMKTYNTILSHNTQVTHLWEGGEERVNNFFHIDNNNQFLSTFTSAIKCHIVLQLSEGGGGENWGLIDLPAHLPSLNYTCLAPQRQTIITLQLHSPSFLSNHYLYIFFECFFGTPCMFKYRRD